ncbi:MAG: peptidase [Rhodospirillales bacterium]|nr:peptidase [Rhodospirillales bacterium]
MTVKITTLANGLRVATDTMAAVETVSLGIWTACGTRHESAAVNGVAHLLEHMLFKGTRRRSAQAIAEEIEAVGGQINAYTARENTAYYVRVLRQDVALALDILADILQHSVFDAEELGRERSVVLQEIGQAHDTPDDIIFDFFQATAFPDQPLGRPVLGTADTVGTMPRQALVDYITGHYAPQRLVLAAAGAIEHDQLVALAERAFSSLPTKTGPEPLHARYVGGDFRDGQDLEQLHLVLGFPSVGYHSPDYYAHSVLSTLLGGGMSSRLFQEVREKRGLVYSVYSFTAAYEECGLFGVYAGTGADRIEELIPVVADQLNGVRKGITEDEVQRSRAQMKASLLMSQESTMARAEQLGQHMLIFGRPVPTQEILAKIDAVDAKAVEQAAEATFTQRPTLAALGPLGRLESFERFSARLT